jgi:hypothetical protein
MLEFALPVSIFPPSGCCVNLMMYSSVCVVGELTRLEWAVGVVRYCVPNGIESVVCRVVFESDYLWLNWFGFGQRASERERERERARETSRLLGPSCDYNPAGVNQRDKGYLDNTDE